ncbi:MAG: metalloregulator ArsR/SmtB family transcription factor [Anaerolineae bacterium]
MTTISIQLTAQDVIGLRFAYSPAMTITTSYALMKRPEGSDALFRRWMNEAEQALHGMEFPFMDAVIPPRSYMADFVTPTPDRRICELEMELTRIRETPAEVIRANVEKLIDLHGENEQRHFFLAYPYESLECLIDELRVYWRRVLAPHWDRMVPKLDDDIMLHARQLALHGADTMLNAVSPSMKYDSLLIQLDKSKSPCDHKETEVALNGRGLYLVPSMLTYAEAVYWQIVPEYEPMLIYGAHGSGLWYESPVIPNPEKELVMALGAGRARVLLALADPAPTSELARKLHMTSGALSQQLKRLRGAGLVTTQRRGYFVYYGLSDRGQKLIDLFVG